MFTACGLFLQLRNCHIDPFLAFRFVLAQLISWFSSTANGSGNICQLSRGKGKGAFAENVFCALTAEGTILLSVLHVVIGDNEFLNFHASPAFTIETGR